MSTYGQRRQAASAHEGRPMAGTSDFTAKGKLCQGATCLSSNKAGLFRTPESFNPGKAVCKICQASEPEPVPHYMPGRQSRAKDAVKQPERPKGRPAGKPNEAQTRPVVPLDKPAKPGQGVQAEKATTGGCSACGVKWDRHDGLAKTCGKLRAALAQLDQIKSIIAELKKQSA